MAGAGVVAGGVAFDSREIEPWHLFVALKGEATDGHLFVEQAFARGASGALVSQPVQHPHVLVPDTVKGLEALGIASSARTSARIAGITGSVGKAGRSEEHTSELQSLLRITYAVFCWTQKTRS